MSRLISNKQKIEEALAEFDQFNGRFVFIEEFGYWKNKYQNLYDEFNLPKLFRNEDYIAFQPFRELCGNIRILINHLENQNIAKLALSELDKVDTEKELVNWLMKNDDKYISDYGIERLKGWEENSNIKIKSYPLMTINASSCKETLRFTQLYNKHYNKLLKKYKLKKMHFKNSDAGFMYPLAIHLRIHGVYLDLLPQDVMSIDMKDLYL